MEPKTKAMAPDDVAAMLRKVLGPAVDALLDHVQDAPAEMSGDGWSGRITCEACPVQIEGEVDGARFYFRERHGETSMGIAATHEDAVGCRWDGSVKGWARSADDEVTHAEAWAYVARWIAEWRAEGRPMDNDAARAAKAVTP